MCIETLKNNIWLASLFLVAVFIYGARSLLPQQECLPGYNVRGRFVISGSRRLTRCATRESPSRGPTRGRGLYNRETMLWSAFSFLDSRALAARTWRVLEYRVYIRDTRVATGNMTFCERRFYGMFYIVVYKEATWLRATWQHCLLMFAKKLPPSFFVLFRLWRMVVLCWYQHVNI